jgi:hypothetical protein
MIDADTSPNGDDGRQRRCQSPHRDGSVTFSPWDKWRDQGEARRCHHSCGNPLENTSGVPTRNRRTLRRHPRCRRSRQLGAARTATAVRRLPLPLLLFRGARSDTPSLDAR